MKNKVVYISLLLIAILCATGCRNKRISYTDMIKRENKEIKAFMDKKGFKVIKDLPSDLKMAPNEFVELKNEVGEGVGVWINVIGPGKANDMAVSGTTPILARFSYQAIGERMHSGPNTFSNIGPTESSKPGVTFIYQADINMEFSRGGIQPAPNSTIGEIEMQPFACNAMMLALKHIPIGSTIQMITSFREGPAFTFQSSSYFKSDNDSGIALYYDQLRFNRKQ